MCRIVSFVSSKGGVGKSSLIFSLALGLSKKQRVCVIDSYFGMNQLSLMIEDYFNLYNKDSFDLKNYLNGSLSLSEVINLANDNLFYIKSNNATFDYLSHYELLKFFIEQLSSEFDYIFIDVNTFCNKTLSLFFETSNEMILVLDDSEVAVRNSSKLIQKSYFYDNIKVRNLVISKARIITQIYKKCLNQNDIEEILKLQVMFVFPKLLKNNFFQNKNLRLKDKIMLAKFVKAFKSNQFVDSGAVSEYKGLLGYIKRRIYFKYE